MKTGRLLAWTATFVAAAACAVAAAFAWGPLSRPDLEEASRTLLPPRGGGPAARVDDVLAIIYSGDGGWANLDRELGGAFAAHGIPVVGVDTLAYFWHERPPAEAAAELDALITRYLQAWQKQRVWLVGFSFGADALPTLVGQLGAENRARIAQLVLLSPGREISFEIQFQGYMAGMGRLQTLVKTSLERLNPIREYPALPPLQALDPRLPVACYYGSEEADDALCTQSGLPRRIAVFRRMGGHHLGADYQSLARELMDRVPAAPR